MKAGPAFFCLAFNLHSLESGGGHAGGTTSAAKTTYGSNTFAEIYNNQRVKPLAPYGATVQLSLTAYTPGLQYIVAGPNNASSVPTYVNKTFVPGADTLSPLPVLTILYVSIGLHQSIISLSSGSTPQANYGSNVGTLAMVGQNGNYAAAVANFSSTTTGSVAVSEFNPATDTEVYALKVESNGVPLTNAQIQTVVGDINGTNATIASAGVVASAIGGSYNGIFPSSAGYDILLTASGVAQPAELGVDFSDMAETDATVPDLTVTGVAAVPEPATSAVVILGAASLLLKRRKNRRAFQRFADQALSTLHGRFSLLDSNP